MNRLAAEHPEDPRYATSEGQRDVLLERADRFEPDRQNLSEIVAHEEALVEDSRRERIARKVGGIEQIMLGMAAQQRIVANAIRLRLADPGGLEELADQLDRLAAETDPS